MKEQEYLTHKVCRHCKEIKLVSEFYKSNRGYYESYCKPCSSSRTTAWRAVPKNRERYRVYENNYRKTSKSFFLRRLRKWGISEEKFKEMLHYQDNACAICKTPFTAQKKCIDHDHSCTCGYEGNMKGQCCGKCVRGILCNDCNIMLGMAHDRLDILRSGIAYLICNKASGGAA